MSEIIDIEIVVDVNNLIQNTPSPSKDPSSPTWIGHNYAYMIAANQYVKGGQATGDLRISADVGDTIRWRMVSQSGNTSYSANLVNITHLSGDKVTATAEGKLAQPQSPVPGVTVGNILLPPSGNNAYVVTPQYDFYVHSDIVTSGNENYNVFFEVLQYRGGALSVVGYFAWDPAISAA